MSDYKYFKNLCKKHNVKLNLINLILLRFKTKCQKHMKRKMYLLKSVEKNCANHKNKVHLIKIHLKYVKDNELSIMKK